MPPSSPHPSKANKKMKKILNTKSQEDGECRSPAVSLEPYASEIQAFKEWEKANYKTWNNHTTSRLTNKAAMAWVAAVLWERNRVYKKSKELRDSQPIEARILESEAYKVFEKWLAENDGLNCTRWGTWIEGYRHAQADMNRPHAGETGISPNLTSPSEIRPPTSGSN